jgi:hypothetical protein
MFAVVMGHITRLGQTTVLRSRLVKVPAFVLMRVKGGCGDKNKSKGLQIGGSANFHQTAIARGGNVCSGES